MRNEAEDEKNPRMLFTYFFNNLVNLLRAADDYTHAYSHNDNYTDRDHRTDQHTGTIRPWARFDHA